MLIKKTTILLAISINSLFACGCIDPSTANSIADEIINNYNNKDDKLAEKAKELNKMIKKSLEQENNITKNLNQIKQLNKYILLEQKRQSAKLEQIKDMR